MTALGDWGAEERRLAWQLANAVCVIDMMLDHIGVQSAELPVVKIYPISNDLCDRVADVFKDYP